MLSLSVMIPFFRRHTRVLAFAGLSLFLAAAYWPSLYHVARGDQINYFAEVSTRQGFVDTVLGTFDLNRTRNFTPGDVFLFRPLLYLFLGLEKFLFGYDHMLWQAAGIAAHLFAVGALYAFLCRIRGAIFAFFSSAFFAFLPINIEAVVWQHITAYVIFGGCVLMALRNIHAADQEPAVSSHRTAALAWMGAAAFLYEAGVWYALCLGFFFFMRAQRRAAAWAWGIVVAYLSLSALDFIWRHPDFVSQAIDLRTSFGFWSTLGNIALLAKWCLSMAVFLSGSVLQPFSRMMLPADVAGWAWPIGSALTPAIIWGVIFLSAGAVVFWRDGTCRESMRRHAGMLSLLAVMAAGYLFIIALGRINSRGISEGIACCLYYPYNFLLLVIVASGYLGGRCGQGRWLKVILMVILSAGILMNAVAVRRVTAQMAKDHAVPGKFLMSLEKFVRWHRAEAGFSFFAGPEVPGNYTVAWLFRRGDAPGYQYSLAEALYRPYFSRKDPKYIFVFQP